MFLRRRALAVAAAAFALIATAAPAAAAWSDTFRETGSSAFVDNSTCTDNADGSVTCQGQNMSVFVGKNKAKGSPTSRHYQVCYSEFTDTFDPVTGEDILNTVIEGCAENSGTVTIDDLTSIAVAATTIDLETFQCDATGCTDPVPAGSVVVTGTWTGTGPVFTDKSHGSFDDGTCLQVNMSNGTSREASFTGTVDGEPFATDQAFAQIASGTFTFRTTCSFG